MKKTYLFLLIFNSVLAFAQFGPKVKFSTENKIKYNILTDKLSRDIKVLRKKFEDDKKKAGLNDPGTIYVDFPRRKDSLCNAYINNVEKLVPADQVEDFWKVVNRRMNKNK